ncbi:DUF853 domain-containing protein [Saprospiraceae bacterium]|nr:DUF853 domain-containing protein [Saprospiraceae bacterium]
MSKEKFIESVNSAYTFSGPSIQLGGAMIDGECQPKTIVSLPLKTMNRHGLIAGATGTGKTKTLQVLAEQLSINGVPTMLMDIKGDLSGIATMGESNNHIVERHAKIGIPFEADGSPVEFLSLTKDGAGSKLRATVTEFGPVLFSKILELNDTQSGILSMIFKYCDDNSLPLIDLKDMRKVLNYVTGDGKDKIESEYGSISSASVGTISRKIVELEQQGADSFFGELSFDPEDLLHVDEDGRAQVSVLRVNDMQDKPKLFSTFMLQMLAEIYATFPEQGDAEKPKLVLFVDEAHLVFEEASKALLNQIEQICKLIRSKGVGIYFVTQNPTDIPEAVLGQLGLKIQHALRAFTAKDRKSIKLAAQNYPDTEYYNVEDLITGMGIGEALITGLNEKGIPTPLVHTYLRAPQSRMGVLTDTELNQLIGRSRIAAKYNEEIDRESAYEILNAKIEDAAAKSEVTNEAPSDKPTSSSKAPKEEPGMMEKLSKNTAVKQIGRTAARELTRGLLGVLGVKQTRRRSSSRSWF